MNKFLIYVSVILLAVSITLGAFLSHYVNLSNQLEIDYSTCKSDYSRLVRLVAIQDSINDKSQEAIALMNIKYNALKALKPNNIIYVNKIKFIDSGDFDYNFALMSEYLPQSSGN